MGQIGNTQNFVVGASGFFNPATSVFHKYMDTVLIDLGRDITVHLKPAKTPCVASDCKFDSFYKKYITTTGQVCETCRGNGFIMEPRYTIYRANIKWSDIAFNQSNGIAETSNQQFGRIGVDFVRTKTVATSIDHIKESVGATIDGVNVELFNQPRQTGWGKNILYTISVWKVVNR